MILDAALSLGLIAALWFMGRRGWTFGPTSRGRRLFAHRPHTVRSTSCGRRAR